MVSWGEVVEKANELMRHVRDCYWEGASTELAELLKKLAGDIYSDLRALEAPHYLINLAEDVVVAVKRAGAAGCGRRMLLKVKQLYVSLERYSKGSHRSWEGEWSGGASVVAEFPVGIISASGHLVLFSNFLDVVLSWWVKAINVWLVPLGYLLVSVVPSFVRLVEKGTNQSSFMGRLARFVLLAFIVVLLSHLGIPLIFVLAVAWLGLWYFYTQVDRAGAHGLLYLFGVGYLLDAIEELRSTFQ